jgi:hypothetical protein
MTLLATGLFGIVVKMIKRYSKITQALLAINHDRLYQACSFYIATEEITREELSNLEYLYNGYSALGGNGTGTTLYNKCKELPLVEARTKFMHSKML